MLSVLCLAVNDVSRTARESRSAKCVASANGNCQPWPSPSSQLGQVHFSAAPFPPNFSPPLSFVTPLITHVIHRFHVINMSTPKKHVWAGLYHDTGGKYPRHQTLLENPEGTFKAIVRYPPPTTPPPITPAGYAPVTQDQMAEVRVRPARKAGKLNFGDECKFFPKYHSSDLFTNPPP